MWNYVGAIEFGAMSDGQTHRLAIHQTLLIQHSHEFQRYSQPSLMATPINLLVGGSSL